MMRLPLLVLLGLSAAGLVALAIAPPVALAMGTAMVMAGAFVRARSDRVLGTGVAATGVALVLVAVLVLAIVDTRQDKPVILGPGTGLTPAG